MKKLISIMVIVILLGCSIGGVFYFLQHQEKTAEAFDYDPGEYFVTDIQGSQQLLKTDIMIHMQDKLHQEEYVNNNHRIRNAIIFILRSKTTEELKSADIQETLNQELTGKLNQEFDNQEFLKIYFNEFVIQ